MNLRQDGSLFIAACCVGWLAGLVQTEVADTLLTTLLGVAVGTAAVGLRMRDESVGPAWLRYVAAEPLAIVCVGIALAYPLGLLAANYKVFEPPS